MNRLIFLLGFH